MQVDNSGEHSSLNTLLKRVEPLVGEGRREDALCALRGVEEQSLWDVHSVRPYAGCVWPLTSARRTNRDDSAARRPVR
jgi:hypothetical protein